jgi:predicted nuclease of predicted toxin-antitoxin system
LKILIDVNLSPQWVDVFSRNSLESIHWAWIGDPRATDLVILKWARENDYVVLTHDLDFGSILAVSGFSGPSVVQLRTQDVAPSHLETLMVSVLREYEEVLEAGALIVVDEKRRRARILPLKR